MERILVEINKVVEKRRDSWIADAEMVISALFYQSNFPLKKPMVLMYAKRG